MFTIVKTFHFDAGHRIWNHDLLRGKGSILVSDSMHETVSIRTKCANPHGHTFYVEVHLESNYIDEQGMIIDTDALKFAIKEIEQLLDHSYILHKDDPLKEDFIKLFHGYKVVIIDIMPTAEGLAQYIYKLLKEKLQKILSNEIKLKCVVVKISNSIIGMYQEG
jgi:6-pyruvoyltetrahydropterin/6-carboxytetrahydropterin synthase